MNQEPIRVKDRLPEEGVEFVLAWCCSRRHWKVRQVQMLEEYNTSHWLPLPPEPKEPPTLFSDIKRGEKFTSLSNGESYRRIYDIPVGSTDFNCINLRTWMCSHMSDGYEVRREGE